MGECPMTKPARGAWGCEPRGRVDGSAHLPAAATLAGERYSIMAERQDRQPAKPHAKPRSDESEPQPHGTPPAASHDEPKGTPNSDRHSSETAGNKAKP